MPTTHKVAVIVGSLRKDSWTRKVAKVAISLAPATLEFEFVEIGDLPHYNQDLETDTPPASWVQFRARIKAFDAVFFATPEYNRSMPGVLKNAIDIGSRPPKTNAWDSKPAAILSVSTGAIAAFGASNHLRQSLASVNMPTMTGPEAYIGGAAKLFDETGNLNNDGTREFLRKFITAFAAWVERQTRPAGA